MRYPLLEQKDTKLLRTRMEVVNLCHEKETESAAEYIKAREVNKWGDGVSVLE